MLNNVDLLASQFVDHGAHAGAPLSHRRADRINTFGNRGHCHLGTGPGFAGDRFDDHLARGNFGHFQLKQFGHEFGINARQKDHRALGSLLHLQNKNLQALARAVKFALHLLLAIQYSQGLADIHKHRAAFNALHNARHYLAFL